MTRAIVGAIIAAVSVSACLETDPPTAPECNPISFEIASTQGDTITTQSGLRYIETHIGTGGTVESCRAVAVRYEGFLEDGTLFDSGSISFVPGREGLIPGFAEGVITARVGGERRLIIPPELGYGDEAKTDSNGDVVIPANSTLIFDVEIVAVAN